MTPFNLVLDTDSYKFNHFAQMPPKTTGWYAFLESRGGRFAHTLQYGPQMLIQLDGLDKPVTQVWVDEAAEFAKLHGVPFNKPGWDYIVNKRGGLLPVRIKSVPEGMVVPTHNVLMTCESTDEQVPWVVGYIETMLMRAWYPITVATQSWHIRRLIHEYLKKTSDAPDESIWFKLHDFGARGVSSRESAMIGGSAHLVSSKGSDTVAGIWAANKFYKCPMAAFSIPAMEHATVTSWGREREADAFRNMLKVNGGPGKILACVSDSYNIYECVEKIWGEKLRQDVIDSGSIVVVRPDSGNPAAVVLKCLTLLDQKFGHSYTKTGTYRLLNNVRVIQGDGINEESIREILETITRAGFSADNVAFGMGGALLQKLDRDTQKFAYKCSEVTVDGHSVEVYKDPITDPGKRSKKGRLDLIQDMGQLKTIQGDNHPGSLLQTIYENGKLIKEYTLEEIRKRALATV
jgi:nicotinamide phosphoribosyltransferase